MTDFLLYNDLLDIYSSLLTKKNLHIMELYYKENFSMQEIANILGVSRSYVGLSIKKSEQKLHELEKSLKIYEKNNKIRKILELKDLKSIKKELNKLII